MIIQSANIVSGFILATPKLREFGAKEFVDKLSDTLRPYQNTIGLTVLALGVLGLIARLGILSMGIPMFGASFPQSIPAILIGLIMSESHFVKYPAIHQHIVKLVPHKVSIGLLGMAVGIGSILFGCIVPIACGVY